MAGASAISSGGSALTGLLSAASGGLPAGFFHRGGIAGRDGSPTRYHSGGIAGLMPNEVPAILQRGEEVLTQRDPRHRDNAGGRTVNVTVNNSFAPGTTRATIEQAAAALARAVRKADARGTA